MTMKTSIKNEFAFFITSLYRVYSIASLNLPNERVFSLKLPNSSRQHPNFKKERKIPRQFFRFFFFKFAPCINLCIRKFHIADVEKKACCRKKAVVLLIKPIAFEVLVFFVVVVWHFTHYETEVKSIVKTTTRKPLQKKQLFSVSTHFV